MRTSVTSQVGCGGVPIPPEVDESLPRYPRLDGAVRVERGTGKDIVTLAVLGPGQFFGKCGSENKSATNTTYQSFSQVAPTGGDAS